MVIKPFDDSPHEPSGKNVAPYLDRFFANVIDFLILVPVISLFNSGIANDLRWSIFNQNSGSVTLLLVQFGFVSFTLFLLYESLFIYFNQATPGHRFLQLKLVSDDGQPLNFSQIFFRSFFKFQTLLVAGIPFLEIVIRPDRTMFYDRLSQTSLITLSQGKNDEIHPDFRKIIVRWVNTSIILIFIFIGLAFYQTVVQPGGDGKVALAKSAPRCQDQLDQYLKGYLSKAKESENLNCARIQVEKSFEVKKSDKTFSYLAQLILTPNDELKAAYQEKYCKDRPNRPLCRADWKPVFEGFDPDKEEVINLLVEMNKALAKNDHKQVFGILDILYTHLDWNKNLELYYLTSFVFLNESQGRSPASEKASLAQWQSMKNRFMQRMRVSE